MTLFNDSSKILFPVINCSAHFIYSFIYLLVLYIYIYVCEYKYIYSFILQIFTDHLRYIRLCNVWDVEINKIGLSSGKLQREVS